MDLLRSKIRLKLTGCSSASSSEKVNSFTLSEIAQHNTATDLWMIIHGKVYDVTQFIDSHPGGAEVLFECAGLDATEEFDEVGHSQYSIDMLVPLFKGLVKTEQLGSDTEETLDHTGDEKGARSHIDSTYDDDGEDIDLDGDIMNLNDLILQKRKRSKSSPSTSSKSPFSTSTNNRVKIENVSIGESNWKQRNRKKRRIKDHEMILVLTLLAIIAGLSYIYLERRKWNEV